MQVASIEDQKTIESGIINALSYFSIFNHPLYIEEIKKFLGQPISNRELGVLLSLMVDSGKIYKHKDLYMLVDDSLNAHKRIKGSEQASELIFAARKSVKVISHFPFVKCVCISGSLSKGYADEKSDIDFFIITERNRLWICRSLLHLYKKLTFLNNRQHAYCMNYFIDESKLEIEEKNKFTATELATLIPVFNMGAYQELIRANNNWLKEIYPNFRIVNDSSLELNKRTFQKIPELVLNMLLPQALNKFLMLLTDKWWRYKWKRKNYPMNDYDLAMKTRWYVSKNHPDNFQKKVLGKIYQQLSA